MEKNNTYGLPTEAEREYACRAKRTTGFSCVNNKGYLQDYAWFMENSKGQTHPAGQLKPNAWGLFDMRGNVYEWCEDRYDEYPTRPVIDPQGGTSPKAGRVTRGGAWDSGYWVTQG